MYNKKVLIEALKKVDAAKAPAKKKDIEVSLEGQWKGKGKYRIPSNQITMQGVEFPVIGKPNVGPPVVMQPGEDYQFPEDVSYVDEVPLDMAKRGGSKSKKFSKSLLATNKLFKKNPLFKKKNYKSKTYDPMAMYFEDGGPKTQYYTYGKSKNQYKKVGNQWYISNDVTDFKWQPIHDPTGNRAKELNKNAKVNPNPWIQNPKTIEGKINKAMGDPQGQSARAAAFYARPGEDDIDNLRHADGARRTQQAIAKATGSDLLGYFGSIGLGAAHELGTMFSDPRSWGEVLQEAYEDMQNNARGARMGYYHTPNATKRLNYLSQTFAMPDGYGAVKPFPGSNWTDPYDKIQRQKAQQEVWKNPNAKPVGLTEKLEYGGTKPGCKPVPPTAAEVQAQILNEGKGPTAEGAARISRAAKLRADWEKRCGSNTVTEVKPETEVKEKPKRKLGQLGPQSFKNGGDISIPDLNQYEDGGYIEAELNQQEIDDLIAQGYRIKEAVPTKAQFGLTMRTGRDIARGLKGTSEFRNMMNTLNEAGDVLPTAVPASVNISKGLGNVKPTLPGFKIQSPMSFSPMRVAASRPISPDSFSPIRFGDDYAFKGKEWYHVDPENYSLEDLIFKPEDWKKLGLQDASDSLRNYLSKLNPYGPDTFKGMGDFRFKDFSEGSNFRRDMLAAAAGPQRQLSTEDFFTDDELIKMAHQQGEYWNARDQFDIDNPEDPTNMIFGALTGDRSRDELFSLLYPNASMPNWREKFMQPYQEKITRETLGDMVPGLNDQGKLSKSALKTAIGSFPKEVSSEATRVREMQDKEGFLFTADPKMVVMEMRGSLGLKLDDIKNASPEQIEKWRQQIIEKVKARDLERYKALLGNPFTAADAYSKMTLNKYGGVPEAQFGLIKYPKTAGLVSKVLSTPARLSNYLTTQTPLANAYKINPLARMPEGKNLIDKFSFSTPFDRDSYYQMLDRAGYNSLLKNGLLQPNFMTGETVRKAYEMPYLVKVNADLTPEGIPFAQMFQNIKSGVYDDLTEAQRNNLNFSPIEGEQIAAKDPRVTVYKKHWLKGYTPADDFKKSAEDLMTQTFSKRAVPVIEYPKDERGYIIKDAEPKINVYEWNAPNQVIPGRSKEDVSHKMSSLKKDLDIGFTQDLLSTYFPSVAPRISLARDTPLLVSPEGRLFDSNTRYWLAREYGQQPDINQVLPLQKYAKDYGDLIYSTDDTSIEDSEKILNYKDYFSNPWKRKKYGGVPEAQLGALVKGAKQLGRIGNIATLGTLNSAIKTVAPIMIHPFGFAEKVGPFTGSPLNFVPGYGKEMNYENNTAFRKFGDTLDYVKLTGELSPAHGPLLRYSRIKTPEEGNWAEYGEPNEGYRGVFGAKFDFNNPDTNLGFKKLSNRKGVLITDAQGNRMPAISIQDPGLSFHRRLPFSNRYIDVNMDKLRNNEFDWRTQGGNLQSLAERYGYATAIAGGFAGMGYPYYQEKLDEYVNEPVSRFIENSKKQMEEFLKGSPVKKK